MRGSVVECWKCPDCGMTTISSQDCPHCAITMLEVVRDELRAALLLFGRDGQHGICFCSASRAISCHIKQEPFTHEDDCLKARAALGVE